MGRVAQIYEWMEKRSGRLAVVGGIVLAVLMGLWLAIVTRSAIYQIEIERLEERRLQQMDQINRRWKTLGEISGLEKMSVRMRELGFQEVPVEYVLIEPNAFDVTSTVTAAALITNVVAP